MSVKLNYFEPLEESDRLAYLQAMDIPVWVLRNEELDEEVTVFQEKNDNSLNDNQLNNELEVSTEHVNSNEVAQIDSSPAEVSSIDDEKPQITLSSEAGSELTELTSEKTIVSNYFLKMVNWKSKVSADKSLLIICRHQIDQPAQSFAKTDSPSQFMNDYIQAINELVSSEKFEIQIQLAHLTEAGLGNDNLPLQETLTQIKPDLILLLGDESIKFLFKSEQDVAQLRGKLQKIEGGGAFLNQESPDDLIGDDKQQKFSGNSKALVSYHPYTLIKNPALKKLAFEDLSLLIKVLKNT